MPRRTTVVLDDRTYARLVEESMRRYRTPRAISKVIDAMVEQSSASANPSEREQSILKLLYSRKVARTTSEEFERDRKELSKRLEKKRSS